LAEPGILEIDGQVDAGSDPQGRYYLVDDPSAWARTGFIEALKQSGIAVTAAETGPNPSDLLPAAPYDESTKIAEHTSATLAELTKVVLKVSYNRGADLMVCLTAVKAGSKDCLSGLADTYATVKALGIPDSTTYQFDGAGSDERDRTSPAAMSAFLRGAAEASWATAFEDGLPILGVDGTLATNQKGEPAAGHVFAKTGTRAAGTPADQGILTGITQVGYIDAKSGRRLTYGVMTRDIPLAQITDLFKVDEDQGAIAAAVYENF
jgi:D-alanyl-D-alanine carboxypeptidase/D-alanyl-D-alanine-endopeptidase (penicillin-binding protein 4)